LRTVLLQNYTRTITKDRLEVVGRREADSDGLPPGRSRLTSPYDTDARWGVKRDEFWNGYKVHLSETCTAPGAANTAAPAAPAAKPGQVPDRPNLITNVATTDATVPDAKMADKIHQSLAARDLLPAEHYLDSGYPSAELIVGARATYGIALITPVLLDTSVQARGNAGFQVAAFTIDWQSRRATCPQGQVSSSWSPCTQHGTDKIVVKVAGVTCGACPLRDQCTTAKRGDPRTPQTSRAGAPQDCRGGIAGLRMVAQPGRRAGGRTLLHPVGLPTQRSRPARWLADAGDHWGRAQGGGARRGRRDGRVGPDLAAPGRPVDPGSDGDRRPGCHDPGDRR